MTAERRKLIERLEAEMTRGHHGMKVNRSIGLSRPTSADQIQNRQAIKRRPQHGWRRQKKPPSWNWGRSPRAAAAALNASLTRARRVLKFWNRARKQIAQGRSPGPSSVWQVFVCRGGNSPRSITWSPSTSRAFVSE